MFCFNYPSCYEKLPVLSESEFSLTCSLQNCCSTRFFQPHIFIMLFSFLISIATAVGTTVGSPTPADSLYEDFSTSEKPYLITPDDYSLLSSNPGDLTFDSSPTLGFDDIPFNDQASSELSDQFSSALETPSCNLGKRDGAACSVESAPQGRLEIPDLLQMGSTVIKENPLLAPITIEIGDDSPGKCANLVYPLNLCCKGPLGTLAGGLYPLVVYETIDECRPGKERSVLLKT